MFNTIEELMTAIEEYGIDSFASDVIEDIFDVWRDFNSVEFNGVTLRVKVIEQEGGEGQGDSATSVVEFEGLGHIRFYYGYYSGEGFYTDDMSANVVRLVTKTIQVYE